MRACGIREVICIPMNPAAKGRVRRHREKVLTEGDLDVEDIATVRACGGHMARRAVHSHSAKADAMGLHSPTQLMKPKQAIKERAKRNKAYEEEEKKVSSSSARSKRQKKA
jgi:hypothetical protein